MEYFIQGENSITRVTTQSTVTVEVHSKTGEPSTGPHSTEDISSACATNSVQCTDESNETVTVV